MITVSCRRSVLSWPPTHLAFLRLDLTLHRVDSCRSKCSLSFFYHKKANQLSNIVAPSHMENLDFPPKDLEDPQFRGRFEMLQNASEAFNGSQLVN